MNQSARRPTTSCDIQASHVPPLFPRSLSHPHFHVTNSAFFQPYSTIYYDTFRQLSHVPPLFPKFFSHPPLPTSRPHRLSSIVHQPSPPFRALRAFSCLSRSKSFAPFPPLPTSRTEIISPTPGGPSGQLPPGYDIISAPQAARTCSRRIREPALLRLPCTGHGPAWSDGPARAGSAIRRFCGKPVEDKSWKSHPWSNLCHRH